MALWSAESKSHTSSLLVILALYIGALVFLKLAPSGPSTTGIRIQIQQPTRLRPLSDTCKMFEYEAYYRANSFEELRALGRRAGPGDMIELVAGTHEPHHAPMEDKDGEGKCGTWPTRALEGTVFDLHGEPGRLITFCGDRERTVIDGIGNRRGGAGIQIVRSTYVRFAGFTIRNLLRAVDIQDTSHAEVTHVTSENTWHEGYRIRYNSTYNLIHHCHIKDTGKGYVGNGEGIYVGTARGRTTDCGNPEDNSDYNVLSNNVFGPNVPSENIDVKEYTTGGVIRDNVFNGTDLRGIHASTSWVALKGRGWRLENNVGVGMGVENGAGIRVLERAPGYGGSNVVRGTTCRGLSKGSVCVFVDARTTNNTVEGVKVEESDPSARERGGGGRR